MKIPKSPPIWRSWYQEQKKNFKTVDFITKVRGPLVDGKYLHWDELIHRTPPHDLTHEAWWFGLRAHRSGLAKELPLKDKNGKPFKYLLVDPVPEQLHRIDMGAGGLIAMPDQITNPETRDQYYVSSLIEEAITSSQLEGAATTRQIAKEMIRTGRKPKDRSEQMILNNYWTMRQIEELKKQPLSKNLVFDIHRLITRDTLDNPEAAGRFRNPGEHIVVSADDGTVYHDPPSSAELDDRLELLCEFANGSNQKQFVHPVIRAIILHFWLAYDHPFVDGNGRTARALFYWSMLRSGFWLFEFITISNIILRGPIQYLRTFLFTETDENDLTYFILYHLDVIQKAVTSLHEYISRKTRQLSTLEAEINSISILNHRQRALLAHALRHPHYRYTIETHRSSQNVTYQTARTDLLTLSKFGLLKASKQGKKWIFRPENELSQRLRDLI